MSQNKHRVQQIQELPEAAQRPELAGTIAMKTACSVGDAQQILRATPEEVAASSSAAGQGTDGQSAAVADSDGRDILTMARALGLRGFAKPKD